MKATTSAGIVLCLSAVMLMMSAVPIAQANSSQTWNGGMTTGTGVCKAPDGSGSLTWSISRANGGVYANEYTSAWWTSFYWPPVCTEASDSFCIAYFEYYVTSSPSSGGTGWTKTPPSYSVGPVISVAHYVGACAAPPDFAPTVWNPTLSLVVWGTVQT